MHNPYNYHIAVRNDAMFFGREKILKRLVSGLSATIPISTAVFGGRRIGKTSLLSKLARVLSGNIQAAGARRFVPCILDLQRGRPLTCSDDFLLWVLDEFGSVWERENNLEPGVIVDPLQTIYRSRASRGPVDAFVQAFQSLDKQGERIRLVILLDESEEIMAVEWGEDLRPNLRALLSNSPLVENIALVMAGATQMYRQITEHDSPLENIMDRYPLSGLSHDAILALARTPNEQRLPVASAEEIWRQTGGHPCIAQYLLHKAWEAFDGQLQEITAEALQDIAETFDQRTHHFSTWTHTLGAAGAAAYHFLATQETPITYPTLRKNLRELSAAQLQSTLDALIYHGLVNSQGRGRRCQYQVAGELYREWVFSLGETREQPEEAAALPQAHIIVHGDYIAGDLEIGSQIAITGDGNIVGDESQTAVSKQQPVNDEEKP